MSKTAIKNMMFFFVCFLIAFLVGLFLGFKLKKETVKFVEIEKTKLQVVYLEDKQQKEKRIEERTENESFVEMVATAYCSCEKCCGVWATKRPKDENGNQIVYTASGTVAKQGRTVAADPSIYPYGTIFEIDGQEYVVEDCGGSIKGEKRTDVYFENHSDAIKFGKRTVKVVVKEIKK